MSVNTKRLVEKKVRAQEIKEQVRALKARSLNSEQIAERLEVELQIVNLVYPSV